MLNWKEASEEDITRIMDCKGEIIFKPSNLKGGMSSVIYKGLKGDFIHTLYFDGVIEDQFLIIPTEEIENVLSDLNKMNKAK